MTRRWQRGTYLKSLGLLGSTFHRLSYISGKITGNGMEGVDYCKLIRKLYEVKSIQRQQQHKMTPKVVTRLEALVHDLEEFKRARDK